MGPGRGPMGGGFGMRGLPGRKAKDAKRTFRRLLGYLKPFRLQLLTVFCAAVLSTVFNIVSPKIMGKATTKLFEGLLAIWSGAPGAGIDFGYILKIVLVLIGLYLFSSLFALVQQYTMAGVAQKTVYR